MRTAPLVGASIVPSTFNSVVVFQARNPEEERGDSYLDLTDQIGGTAWGINQSTWPDLLDTLGGLTTPQPILQWTLSQQPILDSIQVYVENEGVTWTFESETDWVYDPVTNSVYFTEYEPPGGAAVNIARRT